MRLKVEDLRLGLDEGMADLRRLAAVRLGIAEEDIKELEVVRQSLDARRKNSICFIYTVEVEVPLAEAPPQAKLVPPVVKTLNRGSRRLPWPPLVVGAGPAGLFAALTLAAAGYRPLLLERGGPVEERWQKVQGFWQGEPLDPEANLQFGEGGAGAFSDGKLTNRGKDPRTREVLAELVACGAPPEVLYASKAHIGSDLLPGVVCRLREEILRRGGRVAYHAALKGLALTNRQLEEVLVSGVAMPARVMVLAVGHSARDTFELLQQEGVSLAAKPFAMGVRIEHSQDFIDRSQYGTLAGHPRLGPADYRLTYYSGTHRRGAYTFCMCPGGQVVAASSQPGGVVTNGMSQYARDSGVANSGLVVTVGPEDFFEGPLGGVELQRYWERQAYYLGGGNYQAPAQRALDFLKGKPSNGFSTSGYPTYRPGVVPADLHQCLPPVVGQVLEEALRNFNHRLRGFAGGEAVLTGIESRTSSPVRILRDHEGQSVNTRGLYPAGEGAGYAGGIISAAVDGLRVAEAIIARFAPPANDFSPAVLARLAAQGEW